MMMAKRYAAMAAACGWMFCAFASAVPAGTYDVATTLVVTNHCSILMHKNAIVKAVKPMEFVLKDGTLSLRMKGGGTLFFFR